MKTHALAPLALMLCLCAQVITPANAGGSFALLEPPPVARYKLPPPAVPMLYLRGDFNGWSTRHPMQRVEADRWVIDVGLPAGRQGFKLADAQWQAVDLGGDGSEPVTPGRWLPLQGKGSNLPLDVPGAGRYRVELRTGNAVPPRVRVQRLD
jgi:pullulanase